MAGLCETAFDSQVSSYWHNQRIVSQGEAVNVDTSIMTITIDRIWNKTCNMCDRPASTFDRDNRAFCPRHATIFLVIARPVDDEVPAAM
jgi:hypothetical protein